jgi:hypothetical protein
LTILRAEWFYACYTSQTRYDETEFLVGDLVQPSKRNRTGNQSSIIPCSQEANMENVVTEEEYSISRREIDNDAPLPKRVAQLRGGAILDSPKTSTAIDCDDEVEVLSISKLCEDMPTPQRELTKAVLRESDDKNQLSPRAQRQKELLRTPGMTQKTVFEESSPMPPTPDCMRFPPCDYSLQPGSSPNSQWLWKRKIDEIDRLFGGNKSEGFKKPHLSNLVTPPSQNLLHEFFKKKNINYDSPGPRDGEAGQCTAGMSQEAANFLNFDESGKLAAARKVRAEKAEKENLARQKSIEEYRRARKDAFDNEEEFYDPTAPRNEIIWENTQQFEESRRSWEKPTVNNSLLLRVSNRSRTLQEEEKENDSSNSDDGKSDDRDSDDETESSRSEEKWLFSVSSGGSGTHVRINIIKIYLAVLF